MLRLDNKKGWFRLWVVLSFASIFPVHVYLDRPAHIYTDRWVADYPYAFHSISIENSVPFSESEENLRRDQRFVRDTSECITKPIISSLLYYELRPYDYDSSSPWTEYKPTTYHASADWKCITSRSVKSYFSFLVVPGVMMLFYASIAWVRSGFLNPSSGSIQSPPELRPADPASQGRARAEPANHAIAENAQPEPRDSAGSFVWVYLSVLFFALRAIADLFAWFSLGSTISLLLGSVMLLLLLSCFQKRLWRVIRPIAAGILILRGAFNLVVIFQVTAQLGADMSIQMIPNIVISILPIVVGIYVLRAKAIDALVASAEAKSP